MVIKSTDKGPTPDWTQEEIEDFERHLEKTDPEIRRYATEKRQAEARARELARLREVYRERNKQATARQKARENERAARDKSRERRQDGDPN